MTIKQILINIEEEKQIIKLNKSVITAELNTDDEFKEAKEELRLSREVVKSLKEKLIDSNPGLHDRWIKVNESKEKVKELKQQLYASIIVTDKESAEQLNLNLLFI